jgi:hypothetical protein
MDQYSEELWNSDVVVCLDTLREADEAVKTINQDMFALLSNTCQRIINDNTNPFDDNNKECKRVLKNFENKYKKEKQVKHLPGSYRSAKSVIISAVKNGVPLTDGGKPVSKSELERHIREARKSTSGSTSMKPLRSPEPKNFGIAEEYLNDALMSLYHTHPEPLGCNSKDDVEILVQKIEASLKEVRRTYGV